MPELWLFVVGLFVTILTVLACVLIGKGEAEAIDEYDDNAEPFTRRVDEPASDSVVPIRRDSD